MMVKGFTVFCFGMLKGIQHLSDLGIDEREMLDMEFGDRTVKDYFSTYDLFKIDY
jgi:hypothetical protein